MKREAEQLKQGTWQTEQDHQRMQDHINSKNDWHQYYEHEISKALNMPLFSRKPNSRGSVLSGLAPISTKSERPQQ